MTVSQREIVYEVDRRGARRSVIVHILLASGCLLFLLVVDLFGADSDLSVVSMALATVAGVVGVVGFGKLGLIFFRRLNSSEPYLVITPEGLYDNASGMSSGAGWIAWSEIADVRLSRYHNLDCVELVPKSRRQFMRRFSWLERFNRSSRLGYPAVAIRGPLLPVEPAVLVEQISSYWRGAHET